MWALACGMLISVSESQATEKSGPTPSRFDALYSRSQTGKFNELLHRMYEGLALDPCLDASNPNSEHERRESRYLQACNLLPEGRTKLLSPGDVDFGLASPCLCRKTAVELHVGFSAAN